MRKLIVITVLLLIFFQQGNTQTLEAKWLHTINTESSPFFDHSSVFLSNSANYISIGIPVALVAYGYIENKENSAVNGWYIGGSLITSTILTHIAAVFYD